jgi:pimeloyl-ACP methyl ester carboxylesterase
VTPEEARAAGALAGRAVAGAAGSVAHTHRVIASGVLHGLGLAPAARAHHLFTAPIYAAVRTAGPLVGAVAGHAAAHRIDPDSAPVAATPTGSRLQAALNGAVGDGLDEASSALAIRMSLRCNNVDVDCEVVPLSAAYPEPSSRLVLFVHGLCHDENAWTPLADAATGLAGPSYAEQLVLDTDVTALLLRYNTGRHVSENGADLARLLGRLVQSWPVPVTELTLVGHSMGGLVIRSACVEGGRSDALWLELTRLVVTLGTPHTGAPLERFAAATARLLERHEATRGIARLFHLRSAGIKDLRHGLISTLEWTDCDQDACGEDHRRHTPALATADHLIVGSTVTADPQHPLGRACGDILVRTDSALGHSPDGRRIGFAAESSRIYGGLTHFDLLHDPAVYEQLRYRLRLVSS